MNAVLLGLIGLAAPLIVIGTVIAWDRLREPHRDIRNPSVVVDRRTYRDTRRRVERLVAEHDWTRAHAGATAICEWLASERHYGTRRRQQRMAADLQICTARKAEYFPLASVEA
jgi:phage gp16-like protein